MMKNFILTLVSLLIISCSTEQDYDKDLFKQSIYYKHKSSSTVFKNKPKPKTVTISLNNQTLFDFSIWFTNQFKKGLVFEDSLRSKKLSAEFVNATESEIISLIAKRFDKESNRLNNTYYIGTFKQEDRGVLVRYVEGLSVSDINKIIASIIANQGRSTVTKDAVAIIVDRESILTRVSSLLDSLSNVNLKRYVVNFYFINLNVSELERKGVDLTTTGTFSVNLANNIPQLSTAADPVNLLSDFNISGFVEYINSNSFGKLTSTPMFVCYDNIKARVSTQEVVPYPTRIVSPEGTVTTDYRSERVGESIECSVRAAGDNKILLTLDYANSEIVEFLNNEIPRTKGTEFSTSVILDTDNLYLLGEMITTEDRSTNQSFFKTKNKESSKTQIFVKVIQI